MNGLVSNLADFNSVADLRLEAYALSTNALTIVDQKNAWFVVSAAEGGDRQVSAWLTISQHTCNTCSITAQETTKTLEVRPRREVFGRKSRS